MTKLERSIGRSLAAGKWLALPITLLLFLQWPLRDWLHAYSREANDLGQWLFALFVAFSITAATRARAHLATDALTRRFGEHTRRVFEIGGILLGLLPWALIAIITASRPVLGSLVQMERFADTNNPGYFIIKLALLLLLVLVIAQAAVDLRRCVKGGIDRSEAP